jgi:hypothetical protein
LAVSDITMMPARRGHQRPGTASAGRRVRTARSAPPVLRE